VLLKGIKVLDCGSYVAGPAAATVMADFGADVIKIEPPGGDPYRGLLARRPDGVIDFFWDMDARNKRSLCLDIKKPKGREILDALIGETDVFLTNFRPQLLDRLQLGFEHVKAMNEKVIYAQVNSFGLSGADRNRTGFDITAWWARSGLADFVRRPSSLVAHSAPGMQPP
jgi:crotonobetainyl-CoA:carnitine CoA-transferase CaiB-like acyl-CoA transferase